MKPRKAKIERKTKETNITLEFNLDGEGKAKINSGSGFFDHMLELFTRHGLFDLKLKCVGDKKVDLHHSVEDIGICLGKAISSALGDKKGIKRYGVFELPMDEALAKVVVDLGGRPFLIFNVKLTRKKINDFDCELVEEFFRAVSDNAKINIHMDLLRGKNAHHSLEAIFKAFARALDMAAQIDIRQSKLVPSTKGVL